MSGDPLTIAGQGKHFAALRPLAPPNVRFAGHLRDQGLRELYRSSRAVVSASVEEFGICLAEAQAVGVPVIEPRAGGAREIVSNGETGILLDVMDSPGLARAVRKVEQVAIDPARCRQVAEAFSEERFSRELEAAPEG